MFHASYLDVYSEDRQLLEQAIARAQKFYEREIELREIFNSVEHEIGRETFAEKQPAVLAKYWCCPGRHIAEDERLRNIEYNKTVPQLLERWKAARNNFFSSILASKKKMFQDRARITEKEAEAFFGRPQYEILEPRLHFVISEVKPPETLKSLDEIPADFVEPAPTHWSGY